MSKTDELINVLFPFFEENLLEAKKRESFIYFKEIVKCKARGEHLTEEGIEKIKELRDKLRMLGKKHTTSQEPLGYGKTVCPVVWDSRY